MTSDNFVIIRGERIFFPLKILNFIRTQCVPYSDELNLNELGIMICDYNKKDKTLILRGGVKNRTIGNMHTISNYKEVEKQIGKGLITPNTRENLYRLGIGLTYENRECFPYSVLPKSNGLTYRSAMDAIINVSSGIYSVLFYPGYVEVLLNRTYSLKDIDVGIEKPILYERLLSCSENNNMKYIKRIKSELSRRFESEKLNNTSLWYNKFEVYNGVYEQDLEEYLTLLETMQKKGKNA